MRAGWNKVERTEQTFGAKRNEVERNVERKTGEKFIPGCVFLLRILFVVITN